jgi:hypothetical protein
MFVNRVIATDRYVSLVMTCYQHVITLKIYEHVSTRCHNEQSVSDTPQHKFIAMYDNIT